MNTIYKMWKVLVVDDQPGNLEVMRSILSDIYTLAFAKNGPQALAAAQKHKPDLILLDVMMPGMDGYEVCRRLKADAELRHIPVIFVTALSEVGDEEKGLAVGAVDYVTKPISAAVVRARVATHIALVDQAAVLDRLGVAGEFKDNETGAHVRRMGRFANVLAERIGWNAAACCAIANAAPMHDIGKIGIPDCILLKPGPLDEAEWTVMRRHPERGAAIIGKQGGGLMQMAARIALSHHEKWDGSGYPNNLAGEAIPVEGRIVAIADVFDALLSQRPYKEAWPIEKTTAYLSEQSGRHFDPEIVAIFLGALDRLLEIRVEYPD